MTINRIKDAGCQPPSVFSRKFVATVRGTLTYFLTSTYTHVCLFTSVCNSEKTRRSRDLLTPKYASMSPAEPSVGKGH